MMDLSALVAGMKPRFREMIGANIALQMNLEREGLWIKGDVGPIEKVVIELISNARDAMPQGGTLTVETSRVNVGPDFVRRKGGELEEAELLTMPDGNYVRIVVSDTGTGIDAADMHLIFEPFWTTKAVGKGTGLGLSAVYGVVKQSGGWISVESEPGQGARFEVFLPRVPVPAAS